MRRPILAANWKMNLNSADLAAFTSRFIPLVADVKEVDIVIAPPFTLLDRLAQQIDGTAIQAAGQNVNPEESGAYTGEIAPGMLADVVVFEEDLFALEPGKLLDARVKATIVGGRVVFER